MLSNLSTDKLKYTLGLLENMCQEEYMLSSSEGSEINGD
jgi:hypothetical protein